MAFLSEETLTTLFGLQRRLVLILNEARATEYAILELFGETEETIPELDELQNVTERARDSYTRLSRILLLVADAQPIADAAIVELMERALAQAEANADASEPSVQEIKRNWNL
ncbi:MULTISPECIES: hypothetical protein [Kamptonema]|uniref:hypothetical protein n=1 Tax=Kamptonema TaxID=1501433 RepID=UPI0001DACC3C|nr:MULTISPECIES: hypothetical protein [Kamptonema]CBN56317.1 conserved hypothetical protein [Kamptonema sp. PCC 6506]